VLLPDLNQCFAQCFADLFQGVAKAVDRVPKQVGDNGHNYEAASFSHIRYVSQSAANPHKQTWLETLIAAL
jgi:hypothetical protein